MCGCGCVFVQCENLFVGLEGAHVTRVKRKNIILSILKKCLYEYGMRPRPRGIST